ncbi:sporulation initiation factor Spo0A C-terminal domain-containing protein [Anaerotignum sp. MB30-C6]|uniref:sporulation initiation factor Spo0A C-terminal domain-containing protein n=1 Tax=Anaerotignum sp. MB30-C6 TaxID=3070814 RepID=UPI0027DC628A|nr:sporulation initiation factor Spo0A C-terminal domain-containing protein [Anaerotignum sp. MB30-C6]WMI81647.1 sporulation initiation factor Spo0A C-terminal domain-containing protein [Anaerotignum sp. MB30-C6]
MINRKMYRKIAKEEGATVAEVKREMQLALESAYSNSKNDGVTKSYQNQVPRRDEVPTPEEFIRFAVGKVKYGRL